MPAGVREKVPADGDGLSCSSAGQQTDVEFVALGKSLGGNGSPHVYKLLFSRSVSVIGNFNTPSQNSYFFKRLFMVTVLLILFQNLLDAGEKCLCLIKAKPIEAGDLSRVPPGIILASEDFAFSSCLVLQSPLSTLRSNGSVLFPHVFYSAF